MPLPQRLWRATANVWMASARNVEAPLHESRPAGCVPIGSERRDAERGAARRLWMTVRRAGMADAGKWMTDGSGKCMMDDGT